MIRPYVLIAALLLMGVGYAQPLDTSRDSPSASTKDANRPEGGYLSGTWGLLGLFGLCGLFGFRRRETVVRGRREYGAEQLGMPS